MVGDVTRRGLLRGQRRSSALPGGVAIGQGRVLLSAGTYSGAVRVVLVVWRGVAWRRATVCGGHADDRACAFSGRLSWPARSPFACLP